MDVYLWKSVSQSNNSAAVCMCSTILSLTYPVQMLNVFFQKSLCFRIKSFSKWFGIGYAQSVYISRQIIKVPIVKTQYLCLASKKETSSWVLWFPVILNSCIYPAQCWEYRCKPSRPKLQKQTENTGLFRVESCIYTLNTNTRKTCQHRKGWRHLLLLLEDLSSVPSIHMIVHNPLLTPAADILFWSPWV